MRPLALLTTVLLSGAVSADDFTVLKADPKGTAPRKLLYTDLLAECDKHFATRKVEVEKLKTPADIAARQKSLREKFIEALGGFPEKTPLNAKTVGTLKRDGYSVEKVIYESRPDHHVTANLYLPEGKGPFPGVLMPLGHSQNGKAAGEMQRGAILLAKNGIAALVYDPIGQGERSQLLDKVGNPAIKGSTSEHTMCGVGALLVGRSTASYRVWDGIRSLDYLASRPEIDPKKLGCSGCSGGGTLTSYLMALDDRILAAAPSCYITSLERLFATIGPQDAEQNITGQVAFGMDHADYIEMRAPKPTLVLASTRDFFDIQGTWTSFREAKRIDTKLGFPERVDMIEADAGHGYGKSHREAMARFMCRWLKGEDRVITEADVPIEKDATLQCTRTGQVLDDLHGKSVFDLNAALANEYAKKRAEKTWKPEEFRKEVARLIGLPNEIPTAKVTEAGSAMGEEIVIERRVYRTDSGVPLPAVLLGPTKGAREGPLLVYLHGDGKAGSADASHSSADQYARGGRRVLAIDLRGYGETAPAVVEKGKGPAFGVEFKESFLALHLNRPLLGQRVYDLLCVLKAVDPKGEGVELVAHGSVVPVALHAAALDTRIKSLRIERGLASWDLVVQTPISHNQLVNVVPGALAGYDLPDLAARLAPRPLFIAEPVDAVGEPASRPDQLEKVWFKKVVDAYKAAGAEKHLRMVSQFK
jgi:cephalosporin-C deacetylase-like acetyl esterase